jgi:hypothetical protein
MIDYKSQFDKFYSLEKGISIFNIDPSESSLSIFNRLNERANKWIQLVTAATNYQRPAPIIYFDFLNSFKLNASASKVNDNLYFIAINSGTLLLVYDLFLRELSDPDILTKIGDSKQEIKSAEPYPYQITNFLDLPPDEFNIIRLHKPANDSIRHLYTFHLVDIVTDFIIAHETGHILYGHVGYISSVNNSSSLDEIANATPELTNLDLQTLEFDADCFAVNQGIWKYLMHFKNRDIPVEYAPFFNSFEDVLFTWCFAIFSFLRIMGPGNYQPKDFLHSSHPAPRIRQVIIMRCIATMIEKRYPEFSEKRTYEIIDNAINECEQAYSIITLNQPKAWGLIEALKKEGEMHINSLMENWKTLYEKLSDHNFKNLVKPQ